ncbi:MAG: ribosome-associated translation inhibitor RaiA [Fimbriimonadales bacterium]|nr:ribosome-associated translation inhibitor RaiA [Fimbriimonadales bacterium]
MAKRKRKEAEIGEITIRSPHDELPADAKAYIERKLQKLTRFFHRILWIEVAHELQRGQHIVAIHLESADGHRFHYEERAAELRVAVDAAVQGLEHQLARYKERLQRGANRLTREEWGALPIEGGVESPESAETNPVVARTRRLALKPMPVEEALLQAELEQEPFYVFYDGDADRICMLVRLQPGKYELREYTV